MLGHAAGGRDLLRIAHFVMAFTYAWPRLAVSPIMKGGLDCIQAPAVRTYAKPGTCLALQRGFLFLRQRSLGHEAGGPMLATDAQHTAAGAARPPPVGAHLNCSPPARPAVVRRSSPRMASRSSRWSRWKPYGWVSEGTVPAHQGKFVAYFRVSTGALSF
jgi:hypothetical protein